MWDDALDVIASVSLAIITLIVFALSMLIINDLIYGTIIIGGIYVPQINGIMDILIFDFLLLMICLSVLVIALYISIYKCYINFNLGYKSRLIKPFAYFIFMDVVGIVLIYGLLLLFGTTTNTVLIGEDYQDILLNAQNLIPIAGRLASWGAGIVLLICYFILIFKGYDSLVKNQYFISTNTARN
jgi:hypothetical protein